MEKQFKEVSKELLGMISQDQQTRRQMIQTDRKKLNKINLALFPLQEDKSILQTGKLNRINNEILEEFENAVNQQQFIPFINERDSQGRIIKNVFQKENNLTNNQEKRQNINQRQKIKLPRNLQKTCLRENIKIGKQEQEKWKINEQLPLQQNAKYKSIRRPESLGQLCNSYQKQQSKIFQKFQEKQKLYNNSQSISNKITPKKSSFLYKDNAEQRQRSITNSMQKNKIHNANSAIQLPQLQNLKNITMDQNTSNATNSARQKTESSNMLKQLQIKYFKEATTEFHKFQPSLVKDFQQFPVNFDNDISNLKTAAQKLVQKWKKVQDRILLLNP